MAANNPNKPNTNSSTFNLPEGVQDSDWRDDVDVDYAIYGDNEKTEGEYISPRDVSRESISQIKGFQERLAIGGLRRFRAQVLAGEAA